MFKLNQTYIINILSIIVISFIVIFLVEHNEKKEEATEFVGVKITVRYRQHACKDPVYQTIYIENNDPWKLYKDTDQCSLKFVQKYINEFNTVDVVKVEVFVNKF